MIIPELPPISPRQMDMLRAVASMAWADGILEPDEISLILDECAELFAKTESDRLSLKTRLSEYLAQNIPLEEIIPNIKTQKDRETVLRLGYQVIQASRRNPDEPLINIDEAAAYQRLVRLLDLPPEIVAEIEDAIAIDDQTETPQSLAFHVHKLLIT